MRDVSLLATARELLSRGKGILAADESNPTIARRFDAVGLEPTAELRRAYREMLLTTPGIGECLSGVILFEETLHQRTNDGVRILDLLESLGIVAGIKVDRGTVPLAGFAGETVTEGLEGLRGRLEEYAKLGCRFAKWRAVISIGAGRPSPSAIEANSHALARYAAMCQEAGILPILEPEVLMDGDHSIDQCTRVTTRTLTELYRQLDAQGVDVGATLLKTNMVLPGSASHVSVSPDEEAEATLSALRVAVPEQVPGVVFLSGGQSDLDATRRLDAIARRARHEQVPWELSFSFSRALQSAALAAWGGEDSGRGEAQRAFLKRMQMNCLAREGLYREELELASA